MAEMLERAKNEARKRAKQTRCIITNLAL